MEPTIQTINLSQVVFDESLYPRKDHDPRTVQLYESNLEEIEARQKFICVTSDMTLLDGRHRQLAYMKRMRSNGQEDREIQAIVYPVVDRSEKYALACKLNSEHGLPTTGEEKKRQVIRLWSEFSYSLKEAAKITAVRYEVALAWTARARKEKKEQENEIIFDMWLACYTEQEIADKIGLDRSTISHRMENIVKMVPGNHFHNSHYTDPDWKPPIYDVWKVQNKSNKISHPGNTEVQWVDNLLYMYTEPFDIVVDPFAGGGSTIDVCKKRLRRYWASDRLPIVERRDIRQWDILEGPPPLHKRWGDVKLLYLDPPYWKQSEGQYSDDPEDLSNMELEKFHKVLASFVLACAGKLHGGAYIALIIQPTQWKAPEHQVIDHALQLIHDLQDISLSYVRRISCPYESQQYNAQQVEWAKANKDILVITREIIIWRVDDKTT